MKKWLLLAFTLIGIVNISIGANHPDDILGTWISASGKGQIAIYKENNLYYGKLIWLKEPNGPKGNPKLDINNPNTNLQQKPLLGLVILKGFHYQKEEWTGGKIYDPSNGKEYKCFMSLKDSKTLAIRGYIGFSLLGRTEIWTKVK